MLKITRPTETSLVIEIDGNLTSREQFNELMSTVIGQTDFTNIGVLKEHFEKVNGEKTETVTGYFLDYQQRLPGMHAATYAGAKTYSKNVNVKVDLFQIQDSPYATAASAAPAKAATIDARTLAEKLAAARTTAATVAAKKAAAKDGTIEVVAVNAA